jgi:tRNA-dihydrouridine synthase
MAVYFAPMEGLTDSVYRKAHHSHFPGVDAYYMPFLSPTVHRCLTPREARELPKADSVPFRAVPQLMTKVPEDFLWAAGVCRDLGYEEVNLNLGCPSGTVTAKGKGSGMLRDPESLERFLDGIFACSPLPISLKTRLGFTDPEEFPRLLEIMGHYPACKLILHPRVRQQFYDGSVHLESFRYCLENTKIPVCYNGDLNSLADVAAFRAQFPQVSDVMIGRGLIADPGMLSPGGTAPKALGAFMDDLLEQYQIAFGSTRNAMFRLKEIWRLILKAHPVNEKLQKKLLKTTDEAEYRTITKQILEEM